MWARLELQRAPDRLSLSIPLRVRLLPGIISGWLLYALIGAGGSPVAGPRAAALALFAVCALAALYDDRWVFDLDKKKVVRRVGLLFAARETAFDMAELRRIVLSGRIVSSGLGAVRGGFGGSGPAEGGAAARRAGVASYAILSLEEEAGTCRRLEQYRGTRAGDLRAVAAEIAAFCRVPLEDLTARD